MANNYSVSNFTTLENTGDNVANGTILSPVYLYITPDPGFVIQASDFTIGDPLPAQAISAVFSDTTTALAPTNLVKVTVELASWYIHGNSAFTIAIDIDGSAHATKNRLNWTTIHNSGVSNVTQTLTATNKTASVTGDLTTNTCFLDIQQNLTTEVATFVYTAASNFHLATVPSFQIISQDLTKWSSITSDEVYNSDNQLTSIKYSFSYDMGTVDIPLSDGESIILETPVLRADRTTCNKITAVYYDMFPNEATLDGFENLLNLNVVGTEGATYEISIQDNLGLTYDFENDVFSREGAPFSPEQTIFSPSKQLALGRFRDKNVHKIIIPENTLSEATYQTKVRPTGLTKTSTDCTSTESYVITHNKYGVVDYILTTAVDGFGVNAASTTIKSVLNKTPFLELSTFNPASFPDLSTFNNGYFTFSQVLGYTVNGTVASHSAVDSTTVGLTATGSSLKLRVGDSVTGTNVTDGSVISSFEESSIVLSKTPAGAISGGLVFTRTVGISRQPLASDIRSTSPITTFNNLLNHAEYTVIRAVTNSTVISIADDEGGDFSDLDVGMLAEGDNILGTPTIVSVSKGNVVLSSNQTLSAGDDIRFSVAGSKLWIEKIDVTGAGTSSCKLNIDGYIERLGNVDVAAEVVLGNFVQAYVAPTITASTATVTLGGTIIIRPLETDTFSSQTLIISEITSSGNSRAISLSSDGQAIKYLAPLTGTTDTISYKISDGISAESSAANIVITLTP